MTKAGKINAGPTFLYLAAEYQYFWILCIHSARPVREQGGKIVVATPPGNLRSEIEAEGFSFYPLRLRRSERRPWHEFLSILQIYSLYRIVKPNLVHHFTIKPVLYGSLAAKLAGVPAVVNTISGLGYIFVSEKTKLLRMGVEHAYRVSLRGKRVRTVFQNPDDLALFLSKGIVRQDQAVLILGAGVDTQRFHPTPEPQGEIVILLAARMLWDKGVGELVEAGRILQRRRIPHRIVLAGAPDPSNPSCIPESQLRSWQEEGVVTWVGLQEDMPRVIAQSHIFCLPSYREGIPTALIEAASCARPCVTTNAPGCREVVQDGWNGFQVPPKDPVALADALEKLIKDPELRRLMGQRGRELVLERFSKEIIAEQTLALYRELLGEQWNL